MRVIVPLPIGDGEIVGAGLERDHDGVEIGRAYLRGLNANEARMGVHECVVSDIAYQVNRHLDNMPQEDAENRAADDGDFLADMFEMSGITPEDQNWFIQQSGQRCGQLLGMAPYRAAVEAVARAIYSHGGVLENSQIVATIEDAVGTALRNPTPQPPHEYVARAAYYLFRQRGPDSNPVNNWLTAERGVWFGMASMP